MIDSPCRHPSSQGWPPPSVPRIVRGGRRLGTWFRQYHDAVRLSRDYSTGSGLKHRVPARDLQPEILIRHLGVDHVFLAVYWTATAAGRPLIGRERGVRPLDCFPTS